MSKTEEDMTASTSLCECIREVESQGWYWGAISAKESKKLLENQPSGTFLVRDSQSDNYIFTIVYKTTNIVGQTRVPRFRGNFCLGGPNSLIREQSLVNFIKKLLDYSHDVERIEILSFPRPNENVAEHIYLTHPLDRSQMLPSLMYLCRLVIRKHLKDPKNINELPLPENIKKYLASKKYLMIDYPIWETKEKMKL